MHGKMSCKLESLQHFKNLSISLNMIFLYVCIWEYLELSNSPSTGLQTLDSLQFSSVIQSCLSLCNPMDCSTSGFPFYHQLPELLKLMSIQSLRPSNSLILCHILLLLSSIFPSIREFQRTKRHCEIKTAFDTRLSTE